MSLKHRDRIAVFLILLAAVCWPFGQQMLYDHAEGEVVVTTSVIETAYPSVDVAAEEGIAEGTTQTTMPNLSVSQENAVRTDGRAERFIGMTLSFAAIAAAGAAIFVFAARNPIFGPDGIGLTFALLATAYHISVNMEYIFWGSMFLTLMQVSEIVCIFVLLLSLRELLGWIGARFTLSWCLAQRTAKRCAAPQISLSIFVGWILLPFIGLACFFGANVFDEAFWVCIFGFLTVSVFGFLCLWKYGTDLNHFKKQLSNYQNGEQITVGNGAFAQTEAQLLDVQAQHEEAVRTAVTSERFKVELISNVSHDLRTPLTSILGYSELLQKETLTPEGQEQLRRLHQKAGYMNDLVESLFELTKVSSGVVESKKEQIDLVRLMEQTIGLFDDQLVSAGLVVKRSYCADKIPAITDGARMHQVFANLLGNAIKYALAGTRIYLEVRETDESFLIRMMNTASYEMDFKPDEIMQRFARGDKARSSKGSGLGLAIAQTYTESGGGSFQVSVDGDQFSAIVELPKTERNL